MMGVFMTQMSNMVKKPVDHRRKMRQHWESKLYFYLILKLFCMIQLYMICNIIRLFTAINAAVLHQLLAQVHLVNVEF